MAGEGVPVWTNGCEGVARAEGISGHSAREMPPLALFWADLGEGKRTRRVGLGVRSSISMGMCFMPRKRPGEEAMARWRAAMAEGAMGPSDLEREVKEV